MLLLGSATKSKIFIKFLGIDGFVINHQSFRNNFSLPQNLKRHQKTISMKHFIVHLILAISFFGLFANTSQAQQATTTLTGVVTDPNGAVIPGATVTATNSATNLSRTTSTNDEAVR